MIQAPEVQSFIICDGVLRCQVSGKVFINGIYNAGFTFPCFPFTIPMLTLYIACTDGQGKINFKIRMMDDDDDSMLMESGTVANFSDPLSVGEMICGIGNVLFPHEGVYRFEVVCGDEVIKSRRFRANLFNPDLKEEEADE